MNHVISAGFNHHYRWMQGEEHCLRKLCSDLHRGLAWVGDHNAMGHKLGDGWVHRRWVVPMRRDAVSDEHHGARRRAGRILRNVIATTTSCQHREHDAGEYPS